MVRVGRHALASAATLPQVCGRVVTLPVLLVATYFVDLSLVDTIRWEVHLWVGAICAVGVIGLAIGLLTLPPRGAPAEGA
jgi:hypothetical protein